MKLTKAGRPFREAYRSPEAILSRFVDKVEFSDGCWEWRGWISQFGYGMFCPSREVRKPAHRWAYEALVGPIPDGLVLDHLCRNRACVNPDHVEPVTQRENILRGEGLAAQNAAKTHCPRGHAFEGRNLRIAVNGQRKCRACARIEVAPYNARLKAARTHCRQGHLLAGENVRLSSRGERKCFTCLHAPRRAVAS